MKWTFSHSRAIALLLLLGNLFAWHPVAANEPVTKIETISLTSVVDWQGGIIHGLLFSNNDGGELRLNEDQVEGFFISAPISTTFPFNAVGVAWQAETPQDTSLILELRGSSNPNPWPSFAPGVGLQVDEGPNENWGPWQPLVAGKDHSPNDGSLTTADVLSFPPETHYLQVRALFKSRAPRASATLSELKISYLRTVGPYNSKVEGLPKATLTFGPRTLTPRPMAIPRAIWSGREERAADNAQRLEMATEIVLHSVILGPQEDRLAFLRALLAYQTKVLGWSDFAYHYLVDQDGMLYEGRLGGPLAARLPGQDSAIQIGLLKDQQEELPSEKAQTTLVRLLAWLGEAYNLPPKGEHLILKGEQEKLRPNVVAASEFLLQEAGGDPPLERLVATTRNRADQATIRSQWYFAESNTKDYTERLTFFNPTDNEANVSVTIFGEDMETPIQTGLVVPPRRQTNLNLKDVVGEKIGLSVVVDASEAIITERTMTLPTDTDSSAGSMQPSRVWYFAEGSTDSPFQTYLILFNPQDTPTETKITYMKGDGSQVERSQVVPARKRLVITVSDGDQGVGAAGFGTQIVANQPIVAERTMRFGANGEGMHTRAGIGVLSRRWYFAEGTTASPFEMRLLLLNPNPQLATTTVTFMTPDGTSLTRRYAIPPTTRLVVDVNEVVPSLGVATMVKADRPLAVERAIYFNPQVLGGEAADPNPKLMAGSASAGALAPAYSWRFAEGNTTANTRQYLLLSNPSAGQARVSLDFVLADGTIQSQNAVMPANSRYTLAIHELYPNQEMLSAVIRSTQPIVAERSIFMDGGKAGGTTTLGLPGE